MRKRIFLIIFIIVFVVWILYFVASLLLTSPSQKKPGLPPTPTKTEEGIPLPKTSGGSLIISGVKTNDFLSNPIKTNSQGDVLFIRTTDYQITYLGSFNQFIINISTSFAGVRDNAESAFLEKLGITKEDACKLSVYVSAPYVPNPNLSVPKRTLSFCQYRNY